MKYGRLLPPMPKGYVKKKSKEEQRAVRRTALWKIQKSVRRTRKRNKMKINVGILPLSVRYWNVD